VFYFRKQRCVVFVSIYIILLIVHFQDNCDGSCACMVYILCASLCVCLYVCMYVYMYVCLSVVYVIHVCVHVCMCEQRAVNVKALQWRPSRALLTTTVVVHVTIISSASSICPVLTRVAADIVTLLGDATSNVSLSYSLARYSTLVSRLG